jgi:glycerol-3-phosphate acyltransferase PlsY
MTKTLLPWIWIIASYVLGCVNGAYYVVRFWKGADIRTIGTGNPGARNAVRALGWRGGLVVFLVDAGKGALAVLGALALGLDYIHVVASGVAVTVGHIFPVQLGFRGGKGIATAFGLALVLDPLVALLGLLVAGGLKFVASASLSGALAMASTPVIAALLSRDTTLILGLAVLALLGFAAHHADFGGLVRRSE